METILERPMELTIVKNDIKDKKKLLLTGGCGFIGAHLIEGILKETDWEIVIIDRLDISGNLERLSDMNIWEDTKT